MWVCVVGVGVGVLIVDLLQNTRFQRSRQKHGNKGGGSTVQRSRQKLRPGLGSTQVVQHSIAIK